MAAKYKAGVSTADLRQMVTYCFMTGARRAVLATLGGKATRYRFSDPRGQDAIAVRTMPLEASWRHLAPVLVKNIDSVSLPGLRLWLRKEERAHRLGWLLENVRDAVLLSPPDADTAWRQRAARALTVLNGELELFDADPDLSAPDLFDPTIRSNRTRDRVWKHQASDISRRWGIVSELQPKDFRNALWSADESR